MGPERNFTTWLFGRRKEIDTLAKGRREDGTVGKAWQPYGKLYQLLRDRYKPLMREIAKGKNFDFNDDLGGDHNEALSFKERKKALGIDPGVEEDHFIDKITLEKKVRRVKDGLLEFGAPPRNVEIYFRWKSDDRPTQSELAQEYGLSLKQIGRICRQVKKLLPKAKRFFVEE